MRYLFIVVANLLFSHSFINTSPVLRVPTKVHSLKDIDEELSRLRSKTSFLLRHKQQMLKKMTGMNFHNESDIEAHLNRTFSKIADDPEPPVFVKRTKNPFLHNSEPTDESNLKSENFQVIKNIDFKLCSKY